METNDQQSNEEITKNQLVRALTYLGNNYSVMPLPYGQKSPPRLKSWKEFQERKPTEAEVKEWFSKEPCNIAIITGNISGIVVVDTDSPEAELWVQKNLPETPLKSKTKTGFHRLYRFPAVDVKNKVHVNTSSGKLSLDIRANGGYIVAPGSLHPSDECWSKEDYKKLSPFQKLEIALKGGFYYEETQDWQCINPDAVPIFDSTWFQIENKSQSNSPSSKAKVTHEEIIKLAEVYILDAPQAIEGAGGDATTFKVACDLVRGFDLSIDDAMPAMTAWNAKNNPPWTEQDLRRKLESASRNGSGAPGYLINRRSQYFDKTYQVVNNRFLYNQVTKGGIFPVPLTNFEAKIVEEQVLDDGASQQRAFVIEGTLASGRPLTKTRVTAEKFESLSWVTSDWGAQPLIYPVQNAREHLKVAMRLQSGNVPCSVVFTHLGLRSIGDKSYFLHAGGAIGVGGSCSNINVGLTDSRLGNFELPDPPDISTQIECVRSSLLFLELSKDEVTFPLFSGVVVAPLADLVTIDCSIHLAGASGSLKSEIAAQAQSFYGKNFNRLNLPANWASTGNALEKFCYLAKNCLVVIDDFCPTGAASDVARLHKEADRIFRSQGNHGGRARMSADGSSRPVYYPRCFIVSTGEDVPHGFSLVARLLVVEMNKGDVDLKNMTRFQALAAEGIPNLAMSSYILWIVRNMKRLKEILPVFRTKIREEISLQGAHSRLPTTISTLSAGLYTFLLFAKEIGALDSTQEKALWDRGLLALKGVAEKQSTHLRVEDPAHKFVALMRAAFTSHRAHIADSKSGGKPTSNAERWGWKFTFNEYADQGEKIGWLDGNELILEPELAYGMAQRMAREQNDAIAISKNILWKRLIERKIAIRCEKEQKNLPKRTVEGTRARFLVIPNCNAIFGLPETGALGELGTTNVQSVGACPPILPPNSVPNGEGGRKEGAISSVSPPSGHGAPSSHDNIVNLDPSHLSLRFQQNEDSIAF